MSSSRQRHWDRDETTKSASGGSGTHTNVVNRHETKAMTTNVAIESGEVRKRHDKWDQCRSCEFGRYHFPVVPQLRQ
jgi:hypothetical protein